MRFNLLDDISGIFIGIFRLISAGIKKLLSFIDQGIFIKKYHKDLGKPPVARQYMKQNLLLCTGVFGLVFVLLSFVVTRMAFSDTKESIKNINNNYNYSVTEILAPRGDILDCNGDILATSIPNYILVLEPKTIKNENYYEYPMHMIFKNILHMDADLMHEKVTQIEDLRDSKQKGEFLTNEQEALAKKSLYYRYSEEEDGGKTYLSLDDVKKIQEFQTRFQSSNNKEKKKAVCELYQISEKEFDNFLKEVADYKDGGRNFIQKIIDKFKSKKIEIPWKTLGQKYGFSADEMKSLADWRAQRIVGIQFDAEYERLYPNESLAAKIIGFYSAYNPDSSMGLERYYNGNLTGTDGVRQGYLTDDYNLEYFNQDAIKGDTIVTTIDIRIQAIVEEQIQKYMEEIGAKNVGVVVMDPNTGEIRAMADQNRYNPNHPTDVSEFYSEEKLEELWEKILAENKKFALEIALDDEETALAKKQSALLNAIYRNFCISDTYEPGSTFKPLTIAMAYEEGLVNKKTTFVCDGEEKIANAIIHCHNRQGCGELDLTGALRNSCNDFLMDIVAKVGRQKFYDYRCFFGIGSLTGIDLPNEVSASGLNYSVEKLNPVELATSSFGQGFNVTMLQMAASGCALINGGYLYTPHIAKEIRSADNSIVAKPNDTPKTQIISAATSRYLREAMYETVENGTASYVRISGYDLGGKTGTAQKNDRDSGNYVISLESFAPTENPQLYIYVVIDEPNLESQDSSKWAQLLSKRIWMEVLPYLNIHSNSDGIDYIDPGESGDDPDIPKDGYEDGGYIDLAGQ